MSSALPAMTIGLRARLAGLFCARRLGSGTCSGCSAARGLRGGVIGRGSTTEAPSSGVTSKADRARRRRRPPARSPAAAVARALPRVGGGCAGRWGEAGAPGFGVLGEAPAAAAARRRAGPTDQSLDGYCGGGRDDGGAAGGCAPGCCLPGVGRGACGGDAPGCDGRAPPGAGGRSRPLPPGG